MRDLRKDVAYLRHVGVQGESSTMRGILKKLPKFEDVDTRILVALKGIVITRDEGILLLDKTLSELSGVEVRIIAQAAEGKRYSIYQARLQVIDFMCDLVISGSGQLAVSPVRNLGG